MPDDPWKHLPLEKGDQWIRTADGVVVTVAKRIGARQVRYTFPNGGSMVTRIARFARYYRPMTPTTSPDESSSGSTDSMSPKPPQPKHRKPVPPDTGE